MAKILAITDHKGTLLAVLRADPIDAGKGVTVQAVPVPRPEQLHYMLDVPQELLGKSGKGVEELHREVGRRLSGLRPVETKVT